MNVALELPPSVDRPLLLHGDCLDMLRALPAESADVCITDPPAGIGFMGKQWDSFAGYVPRTRRGREVEHVLGGGDLLGRAATLLEALGTEDARAMVAELRAQAKARPLLPAWARGFVVFLVDVWSEVFRVLKPGGFVCAWALPKTADLAGLALRAADFDTGDSRGWVDVHESVLHLFGQGMNKTGDVGKQIDKMHGAKREVIGTMVYGDGHVQRSRESIGYGGCDPEQDTRSVTAPATDDARRWTGWYPGIAPGHEQWLIARKPTPLTYARQALTHGCGLFNVNGCKIPRGVADRTRAEAAANSPQSAVRYCTSEFKRSPLRAATQAAFSSVYTGGSRSGEPYRMGDGSHPRNVVLTRGGEDCPVEGLDRQSGLKQNGRLEPHHKERSAKRPSPGDYGGASRYFTRFDPPPSFDQRVKYCAKNRDRRAGLRVDIDNGHATPKHLDLMRWLVRLLAAKAEHTGDEPAIVLDPFMGSGTTGVACVAEQVRFVGIERDPATVRSIVTPASTEQGESAPAPVSATGIGRVRCERRRSKITVDTIADRVPAAPAPDCADMPAELDSFGIASGRIYAAIGSPKVAAEANAAAPVGAQLGLL